MMDIKTAFAELGFWEDTTEEEQETVFGMDFPGGSYVMVTNDNGRMPEDEQQNLVLACYDQNDCYLWGSEFKNLAALQAVCKKAVPESAELLTAFKAASGTLKEE